MTEYKMLVKRAAAFFLCLCVLLSGAPLTALGRGAASTAALADEQPQEQPGNDSGEVIASLYADHQMGSVNSKEALPGQTRQLMDFVIHNVDGIAEFAIAFVDANDNEITALNPITQDGQAIKLQITFFLDAALTAAVTDISPNDVFEYRLPGNLLPLSGKTLSGDALFNGAQAMHFDVADSNTLVQVSFSEKLLKGDYGNYHAKILLEGTLNRKDGGDDYELAYDFDGKPLVIYFLPDVGIVKSWTDSKILYDAATQTYWADYSLTLTNPVPLKEGSVITDTAGKWVQPQTGSFLLDGSTKLSATQTGREGGGYITTITLPELTRGTHTLTYRAQIVPDKNDYQAAFANGGLNNQSSSYQSASATNSAAMSWETINHIPGKSLSNDVRVNYQSSFATLQKGMERDNGMDFGTSSGNDGKVFYDSTAQEGKQYYGNYQIKFTLAQAMETVTLTDVYGKWITGFDDTSWVYTSPEGNIYKPVQAADPANKKTTFTYTNVPAGEYTISYRAYIDPKVYTAQSNNREERKNTVTLVWTAGGLSGTLSAVKYFELNRTFKKSDVSKQTVEATQDMPGYYLVNWKVSLDLSPLNLNGLALTDTLPPYHELVGGLTLTSGSGAVSSVLPGTTESPTGLTYNDTPDSKNRRSFVYIFGDTTDSYTITYQTRISMEQVKTDGGFYGKAVSYTNNVTVGNIGISDSVSIQPPTIAQPSIVKDKAGLSNSAGDPLTGIVKWVTTIRLNGAGEDILRDMVIKDYGVSKDGVDTGYYIHFTQEDQNSVSVRYADASLTQPEEGSDYTLSFQTQPNDAKKEEMIIQWNGVPKGDIVLSYQTHCDLSMYYDTGKRIFRNTAFVAYGPEDNKKTLSDYEDWYTDYFSTAKASKGESADNTRITWEITGKVIDGTALPGTIRLTETLPEYTTLDETSVKAYWGDGVDPAAAATPVDCSVTTGADGKPVLELTLPKYSAGKGYAAFRVTFDTLIDVAACHPNENETEKHNFTNKATVQLITAKDKTVTIGTPQASEEVVFPGMNVLEKSVSPNGRSQGPVTTAYLTYTIKINSNMVNGVVTPVKLGGEDETFLTLTDDLQNDLVLATETVKVTGADGSAFQWVSGDPGPGQFAFSYQNHRLTVKVPDETACTLVFGAYLGGALGQQVSVDNTVSLQGKAISSSTGGQVFVVSTPNATITGENFKMNVEKRDAITGVPLEGVLFAVFEVNDDATASLSSEVRGYARTDENGVALLPADVGLKPDTIYCLKEVEAAPGYQSGSEWYYLFAGNSVQTANAWIARFKAAKPDAHFQKVSVTTPIQVTNTPTKRIKLEYGKVWVDDGITSRRPDRLKLEVFASYPDGNGGTVRIPQPIATQYITPGDGDRVVFTLEYDSCYGGDTSKPYTFEAVETAVDADGNVDVVGTAKLGRYYSNAMGAVLYNTFAYPNMVFLKTFEGYGEGMIPQKNAAAFELYKDLGSGNVLVDTWYIGADTPSSWNHSITGKDTDWLLFDDAVYTLREISVMDGFAKAEDIRFTLEQDVTNTKIILQSGQQDGAVSAAGNVLRVQNRQLASLEVTKLWVDSPEGVAGTLVLPESVTVELLRRSDSASAYLPFTDSRVPVTTKVLNAQNDWRCTFEGLPGYDTVSQFEYSAREVAAVPGFVLAGSETTHAANGKDTVVLTNRRRTTNGQFSKTDLTTGAELPGASMELVLMLPDGQGGYTESTQVEQWQSSTQPHQLENEKLVCGQVYALKETTAPYGYLLTEQILFRVGLAADGQTPVFQAVEGQAPNGQQGTIENGKITMKDQPSNLFVLKTDAQGVALPGASLELYAGAAPTGEPLARWVSGSKAESIRGVLTAAGAGHLFKPGATYTLRETAAPGGYVRAADYTFTYTEAMQGYNTANPLTFVSLSNRMTELSILKTDAETGRPLAGASFSLYEGESASGTPLKSWVSTTQAEKLTGLVVGRKYTVAETAAPGGYLRANLFTFEVQQTDYAGSPEYRVFSIANQHIYRFLKLNSANSQPLAGATLALYEGGAELVRWQTSLANNGYYDVTGLLKVGGVYTLRELESPELFVDAADIVFTVNQDGYLVTGTDPTAASSSLIIIMYDAPVPNITPTPTPVNAYTSLTVTKRWEDQADVLGRRPAQITLYLYQKLSTDARYGSDPFMTVQVSTNGTSTWRFTFQDLPNYVNGRRYDYMVQEEPVTGYTVRYLNDGRTIINSIPEEDRRPTPTPTIPGITPTPAPSQTVPAGVRFVDGDWVYIDENGVPLGLVPQTGDDANWLLYGLAILLPLALAAFAAVQLRKRKKQEVLEAHRNK